MCDILYFPDDNSKLKSLLAERNFFDSVLFIFEGSRRYRFSACSLGICDVSDLLAPLGTGLFRCSPLWKYYLYPCCTNFNRGIAGLCGEVLSKSGSYVAPDSCHIFVDRSRRQLKILYQRQGEYIVEHRLLDSGLYQLEKAERSCQCLLISWTRLNKLLKVHKRNKVNKKMPKT